MFDPLIVGLVIFTPRTDIIILDILGWTGRFCLLAFLPVTVEIIRSLRHRAFSRFYNYQTAISDKLRIQSIMTERCLFTKIFMVFTGVCVFVSQTSYFSRPVESKSREKQLSFPSI